MRISLVIFCFNESGTIAEVVSKSLLLLQKISSEYEIIVVDDGSTDSTAQQAHQQAINHPDYVTVISHAKNLGIGMALRTGYERAKMDYICAIPGDGQFDVSQLSIIIPFDTSTYYSFYRISTNYNLYRQVLTWTNRLFNQHILGIYLRDVNWIKMYHQSQLLSVKPQLKSSLIESEICAKLYRKGVMPIEIPSGYLARTYGTAKGGGWKTLSKAVAETIRLIWVVKRFDTK